MPTLQASSMLTFYVAECQIAGSCWCPVGKKPSGIFCNFSSFPSFSCWGHRHAVLPGEGGPVIPQNAFHKQQSNAAPSHQMLQLICGQQVGEMWCASHTRSCVPQPWLKAPELASTFSWKLCVIHEAGFCGLLERWPPVCCSCWLNVSTWCLLDMWERTFQLNVFVCGEICGWEHAV